MTYHVDYTVFWTLAYLDGRADKNDLFICTRKNFVREKAPDSVIKSGVQINLNLLEWESVKQFSDLKIVSNIFWKYAIILLKEVNWEFLEVSKNSHWKSDEQFFEDQKII